MTQLVVNTQSDMSAHGLDRLAAIIAERARDGGAQSYTRRLIDKGLPKICKKLGEEAVEVVIAALAEERPELVGEIADLLYHLLVMMQVKGISLAEVSALIEGRMVQSGLEEKAARKQP